MRHNLSSQPNRRDIMRVTGIGLIVGAAGCSLEIDTRPSAGPEGSASTTGPAQAGGTGSPAASGNMFTFVGGAKGGWRVTDVRPVKGAGLEPAERLDIVNDRLSVLPPGAVWMLRGFTSNLRYATAAEVERLKAVQPSLGRPEATHAALIPIRKSAAWWAMPQDRRRAIFEETSKHTAIGLGYLPAVARKLHHSRDLGEPFDFLTWFEFAPDHAGEFDGLLAKLRETEEWKYVEREAEVRLVRA